MNINLCVFHWVTRGPISCVWPVTTFLNDGSQSSALWEPRENLNTVRGWMGPRPALGPPHVGQGAVECSTLCSDIVDTSPTVGAMGGPGRV